jgi:hypothetical protein
VSFTHHLEEFKMGNSYLYNSPAGFAGGVSRPDKSTIEPRMLVALTGVFAQTFGQAMRFVTGGIQQFQAALTKADFAGVLVREVPGQSGSGSDTDLNSGGVPNPLIPQGLLVTGYAMVPCTAGTPTEGGTVYVRTVLATNRPIGAFEAVSDGGNSFALDASQAIWNVAGLDANNMAEIRVGW